MAYSLPLLVWLRTFEASARHLSFARAAVELALTPAAVGQHIRSLEAEVGFNLFERQARGVALTTMGRAYFPLVRKSLDDLSLATTNVFGAKRSASVLTVRCSVSFATLCLVPALSDFRTQHPGLSVKLYSSIWGEDLRDERIDLEIRYGDGRWDGFDVQSLSEPASVPVCPPATRFGRDPVETLRLLASQTPIHVIGLDDLWARLSSQLGWPSDTVGRGLSADTSAVALEMVSAGLGCALISSDLVRLHEHRGLVVVPKTIVLRHERRHFVLTPTHGRPTSAETLAFRDWLTHRFEPKAGP